MNTELSTTVRNRCQKDQLPPDHALRKLSDGFDVASSAVLVEPSPTNTKKMLGAWARLRKEWCAYSGEPLI